MSIALIPQMLVIGVATGVIYMMLASGLTLIFGIMRQINNTHGVICALGGVIGYVLVSQFKLNFFLTLILVALIFGIFGLLLERLIFRNVRKLWIGGFLASTGIWFIMEGIGWQVFGTLPRNTVFPFRGVISLGSVTLSEEKLAIAVIGAVFMLILYYLVHHTAVGRQMRAVQEDPEAAALQGIDADRVCSVAFFVGCSLAGAAGTLLSAMFMVDSGSGLLVLLKASIVIAIGGLGNIQGAVLAGLLLGLSDSIIGTLLGAQIAYAAAFALMLFVLSIRPMGLAGTARE